MKNRKLESVLTGPGENAQLLPKVKEQIAKHAERYQDVVAAGEGAIEYAFIKEYGSEFNARIANLVQYEFAAQGITDIVINFGNYGDVPF